MECITIKRTAIRCTICDTLLATREENIAIEDFHDIGMLVCHECFKEHGFDKISGDKKGHTGVIYKILHQFKAGDNLKDYDRWVVVERCTDIRFNMD